MALARAFTSKRSKRPEISLPEPQRSFSVKQSNEKGFRRAQISAPVKLLSTTNMLSFNAPDLHSSSSSTTSADDSDAAATFLSSPATSVDAASFDSRPGSPEPNHLSTYFSAGRSESTAGLSRKNSGSEAAPSIPHRVPSHTAATHKALARKRSVQRMSPPNVMPTTQPAVSVETAVHPFGKELEQVDEIAEEYGVAHSMLDEEERIMCRKGLLKFDVQDYMSEIENLFSGVFEDNLFPLGKAWI